jgi:hypothetical protein
MEADVKFQIRRAVVTVTGILLFLLLADGAPIVVHLAAQQPDLRSGDIFVADVEGYSPFWGYLGPRIIWRVRDGEKQRFCQSSDELFFGIPEQMIVDSAGRVVFIAKVGPEAFTGPRAMFRCDGATVEVLAYFALGSSEPAAGFPDPFPDSSFSAVTGLHLAKMQSIEISPDHQTLITEDAYVMAMREYDPQTGAIIETKVRRYRAETGKWDVAPDAAAWRDIMPAMVNHGGATYSTAENVLRRTSDPLRLEVHGTVLEIDFQILASMFGGTKEIGGLLVDDTTAPNHDLGCGSEPASLNGHYASMSAHHYDLEYDEYGNLGLVMRTNSGASGAPYYTNVSEILINDNPNDDYQAFFNISGTGCQPAAFLGFTSLVPFFNPVTGVSNELKLGTMTATSQGLVGISGGNLAVVVRDQGLLPIATGFVDPQSVAVYPAAVQAASGTVLIIQINSPVDVLVTDADGNRIGVDPATGEAINDFGDNGFDSGPGEPRLLGIRNPTAGAFDLDTIGTGEGPYSIQVYGAELGQPRVDLNRINVSGTAHTGHAGQHDFTMAADTKVAFVAPPPPLDSTPPAINATVAGSQGNDGWYVSDVAVSWSVSDGESTVASAAGCSDALVTADTTGQTFSCEASSAGGIAAETITLKKDATPPSVVYSGQQAVYTLDQIVNITCSASDAISGLGSTTCAGISGPAYLFGLEPNVFSATAVDIAGNSASASVSFSVAATTGGICTLTEQFAAKHGISHALCQKLDAGSLRAFVNQVTAQAGKALSDDEARILIGLAARLPQ